MSRWDAGDWDVPRPLQRGFSGAFDVALYVLESCVVCCHGLWASSIAAQPLPGIVADPAVGQVDPHFDDKNGLRLSLAPWWQETHGPANTVGKQLCHQVDTLAGLANGLKKCTITLVTVRASVL